MNEFTPRAQINRKIILAIFAIVPIIFFLGLINYYYYDASFLPYMGMTSFLLPLYLLFFELPHIITSFIGFLDREYVVFYARHLFIWLPLILAGFSLLVWWQITLAIVLYLVATTYHVMSQLTGISLMFGIPKNTVYQVWSWMAIFIATFIYLAIAAPHLVGDKFTDLVFTATIGALTIFGLLCAYMVYQVKSFAAKTYIVMTLLMLVCSYILVTIGYIFLAIFMIRFIHDITAFLFYVTHEMNRNQKEIKNYLYRLIPYLPKSLMIVVPAIGVGIGLALRETITGVEAIFIVSMLLAIIHYYLESIIWRRGSLHRQYVKVI